MDFLQNFPDILKNFDNYHIQGKMLDNEVEKKLDYIYKKNLKYDFFSKNLISIDMIIKELIQNCIKAHIKRWIFKRYKLNPLEPLDYQKSLRILRHILYFIRIEELVNNIKDYDYYYDVYLSFHKKLLLLHIINEGNLLPIEEKRIRLKFQETFLVNNLYDFYLKYSDTQEGAGMGIAIIIMLLKQIGLDSRHFVIFNYQNNQSKQIFKTISRIYIPFDKNYLLPRKKFDIYLKNHSIKKEELREKIKKNLIYIPFI
ncbi:MAG: hypothetical protein KatS3mg129_2816 [Leptospiraceae bacterium]|nr:MAG: hypothetical protein KatS3mg129_2816 [Leptospiraceae bacterium]